MIGAFRMISLHSGPVENFTQPSIPESIPCRKFCHAVFAFSAWWTLLKPLSAFWNRGFRLLTPDVDRAVQTQPKQTAPFDADSIACSTSVHQPTTAFCAKVIVFRGA